jgi:glycosyltransferase involved in cell wall biosynthesis
MGILGGQAVQADRLIEAWRGDADVNAWLVPVNPVPPGWLRYAVGVKYLRTIATELTYGPLLLRALQRADVVHVFSASYTSFLLAPLPAVLVARLLGKPVVMNYRSGEAPDHLRRSAIARRTLRGVDRNVVPSRFLHSVFAQFGIESDIIPNIVDLERFAFRRRDPLRPAVLSTRNFEPLYNVACTLRAFRLVQDRHPDATLTLVGGGSQDATLRQLAAELGLRNVRFAGRVAPADMWRYYADADIYLQTPDIDNMPASVLEAFASGCAVVATNAGGVPAILTDGVHGLLVERNDHEAAAARLLALLDDPALAARLASAARADCEQYRWEAVRARWIALYESVLRPAGRDDNGRRGSLFPRLRKMGPAELRFRVTCESRKAAAQLRASVVRPAWHRDTVSSLLARNAASSSEALGRAQRALERKDWMSAHLAFAAHFSSRAARFPLDTRTLPRLRERIAGRFPTARADASLRADRMLEGRYDVLGYHDVEFGVPPAWQRDPIHRREAAPAFWSTVPYLDPGSGDHKVIWEINRHQHWLALARAHELTGDRRYYAAFTAHLEDWMRANPPLHGINWASVLELAFRSLSWLWALHFFAPAALDDPPDGPPWIVDLLLGLDRQLTHIEHNLSTYFSPNTHLSGEALSLYVAGRALPELASSDRRATIGRRILLDAIDHQIRPDGGHAELSAHYHRYSTDFYLLATIEARVTGDSAAIAFEEAALRQARFLRAITDDHGRLPLLGDDDGGQLLPICGREPSDCRDTLASAALVLGEPALAVSGAPEETVWLCGTLPSELEGATPAGWPSTALTESGYYVSRSPSGDHLLFDAGPHGFLNGGHAHADALSIVLTVAGRPFLVDAGTATYTMDPAARDRFRSTAMHNTIVLNGRPQSEPSGPFHWASRTDSTLLVWKSERGFDYVEASHDGYLPVVHARAVFAVHGLGWIVIDHLLGSENDAAHAETFWHVHPDWTVSSSTSDRLWFRHRDGTARAIAATSPLRALDPEEAAGLDGYSPAYGRIERGLCVRARSSGALPCSSATFIPARQVSSGVSIQEVRLTHPPGPRWHAAAFRLSWDGYEAIVLAATERSRVPQAGGPDGLWGCEATRTDARAGFVDLSHAGAPAHMLVHGSRVEIGDTAGLLRA